MAGSSYITLMFCEMSLQKKTICISDPTRNRQYSHVQRVPDRIEIKEAKCKSVTNFQRKLSFSILNNEASKDIMNED